MCPWTRNGKSSGWPRAGYSGWASWSSARTESAAGAGVACSRSSEAARTTSWRCSARESRLRYRLRLRGELLESRIAAQRRERRIDPQPRGCEIVRALQNLLEDVDRALRLSSQRIDARED